MEKWKLLSKNIIYDDWYVKLERWKMQINVNREKEFSVATMPDASIVFAMTEDNQIIILEQYFLTDQEKHFSLVAGFVDRGSTPAETARKELREESGCEAEEWISLGSVKRGKWTIGEMHFFLALGVRDVGNLQLEESEFIKPRKISLKDFLLFLENDKMQAVDVQLCAYKALHYLGKL
ncbi:MAG: NUDIX hydrolase [Candidatus Magasanikbacteria bacterium]